MVRMTSEVTMRSYAKQFNAGLFVCVFLLLMTVTSAQEKIQANTSWYDSYLQCHGNQMTLPVPMATNFEDLQPLLPSDGSSIWIGGRFVYTSWRWSDSCGALRSHGCAKSSELDLVSSRLLPAESPFECLTKCQSAYVAMHGSECYCLKSQPQELTKLTNCDVRCASNFDQRCGGVTNGNFASIYALQNTSVKWDPNEYTLNRECGYIYLPNVQTPSHEALRIRTADCGELIQDGFKQIICQKCFNGTQSCNATRFIQYMSWTGATEFCKGQGMELLNSRTAQSLPLITRPYNPENYWINLSRQLQGKWINGSTINFEIRKYGLCLSARKGDNNDVVVTALPCSDKLSFLCTKGTKEENTFPESAQDNTEFCMSSAPQTDMPETGITTTGTPTSVTGTSTPGTGTGHGTTVVTGNSTSGTGTTTTYTGSVPTEETTEPVTETPETGTTTTTSIDSGSGNSGLETSTSGEEPTTTKTTTMTTTIKSKDGEDTTTPFSSTAGVTTTTTSNAGAAATTTTATAASTTTTATTASTTTTTAATSTTATTATTTTATNATTTTATNATTTTATNATTTTATNATTTTAAASSTTTTTAATSTTTTATTSTTATTTEKDGSNDTSPTKDGSDTYYGSPTTTTTAAMQPAATTTTATTTTTPTAVSPTETTTTTTTETITTTTATATPLPPTPTTPTPPTTTPPPSTTTLATSTTIITDSSTESVSPTSDVEVPPTISTDRRTNVTTVPPTTPVDKSTPSPSPVKDSTTPPIIPVPQIPTEFPETTTTTTTTTSLFETSKTPETTPAVGTTSSSTTTESFNPPTTPTSTTTPYPTPPSPTPSSLTTPSTTPPPVTPPALTPNTPKIVSTPVSPNDSLSTRATPAMPGIPTTTTQHWNSLPTSTSPTASLDPSQTTTVTFGSETSTTTTSTINTNSQTPTPTNPFGSDTSTTTTTTNTNNTNNKSTPPPTPPNPSATYMPEFSNTTEGQGQGHTTAPRTPDVTMSTNVNAKTEPPYHDDGPVTADDLLPLYLLIGILAGMVVVITGVVLGIFRYRTHSRFARLRFYDRQSRMADRFRIRSSDSLDRIRPPSTDADSFDGTSYRDRSFETLRSEHSIEADPEFRFVESSSRH